MHPIGRKGRGRRARRFSQNSVPIHPILLWLAEAAHESGGVAATAPEPAANHNAARLGRHVCG
jgi:hypothetical protein